MMQQQQSPKRKIFVDLFNILSSCGFRKQIVARFVFQPPRISYTLRPVERTKKRTNPSSVLSSDNFLDIDHIRVHRISCLATSNEPRIYAQTLVNKPRLTETRKSRSLDQSLPYSDDSIKEIEPISISPSRLLASQLGSEEAKTLNPLEMISARTQNGMSRQASQFEYHYQPTNKKKYPLHQLFLVNHQGQIIEVDRQENLNISGYFLHSKGGNQIASLFIEIQERKVDYCLLFSHGNAADLGYMLDTYLDLAYNLNLNVFAYEYSGYGQSSGRCNDIEIINDIKCAYNFLVEELKFSPTQIIPYGYSIGSGPSIALTASYKYPVGGLVVHSGFSSGLRVIDMQLSETPYYDFFPNVDLIKNVNCPVFLLHGTDDRLIGIEHATMLSQNCSRLFELWKVENAGHSGIDTEQTYRRQYFQKLRVFYKSVILDNEEVPRYQLERRNQARFKNEMSHYYQGQVSQEGFSRQQTHGSEQKSDVMELQNSQA